MKNVVNFEFDSKLPDFENVRKFVENGGIRTASNATSGKTFGDVLFVSKDTQIKIGEKPINRGGRQVLEPVMKTIPAGLYTYANDTEGAITLIPLDDPGRQANTLFQKSITAPEQSYAISLGRVGKDSKISPQKENLDFLKTSIQSTQWLFGHNPNMSVMVEKITPLLYRGGTGVSAASEQDRKGQVALRNAGKSIMAGMTSDNVVELAELIANTAHTNPKFMTPAEFKSIAKDMVRLSQDAPSAIGFRVDYGKIYLNVYSGTAFEKNSVGMDTRNPVVVHSFSFTDKATFPTESGYTKEFTGPLGWFLGEVDYDNPRAVWERGREREMRALYNANDNSLVVTRPRYFVIDVTVRPEDFNGAFDEEVRLQGMRGLVPTKKK